MTTWTQASAQSSTWTTRRPYVVDGYVVIDYIEDTDGGETWASLSDQSTNWAIGQGIDGYRYFASGYIGMGYYSEISSTATSTWSQIVAITTVWA